MQKRLLGRDPGGGGTPIWSRRECSSEILNLTPKRDQFIKQANKKYSDF